VTIATTARNGAVEAEDERAITAVLLRYATAIDTRDWAMLRSCFAEDVEANYAGFGTFHGLRAITEFMRRAHAEMGATLHRLTNISVHREAGVVRSRCYVDALLMPGPAGGSHNRGIGWYEDSLVRTGQGWKIARRVFHPVLLE
jgi:hypothetical protein